jgi:protein-S-isoprenylcysteine O-methyltransferase Ste14
MAHEQQANRLPAATQSQPRKFWMRWRVRFGYPVAIIYWLLATPTWRSIAYGTIVAALGLMVRAAAAGYLRKDRELAVTGPYALTRNPLYLGSAILAAGFVVASHAWIAGLLVSLYFGIFYYAVMRNEEEDLRMRFGQDFNAYATRVPLFFPNPFASEKSQSPAQSAANVEVNGGFSWAQYRRNREYRALFGAIGAMAMVCLRMYIRARFGY